MSTIKATIVGGLAGTFLNFDHLEKPFLNGISLSDMWTYMTHDATAQYHIFWLLTSFMLFLYIWIFQDERLRWYEMTPKTGMAFAIFAAIGTHIFCDLMGWF